ncbi:MAG: extracellular solute-binding protein [Dechloromonas sp.]|nr:MAG: extracellular solute-binding protein [Dechloromonas sp.]
MPALQAAERPVLRVLAWPGYADPDVVQGFEQRHKVRVEVTQIDSDTALWQRMSANGGRDFDVFAVNTAELQRYIDGGMALPVDPAAIANIRRQLPRFRQVEAIPGLLRGGQVYGIPYTYAEMGLIYDRSQFVVPPDSLRALWDPALHGRVLAYNGGTHNFSLAMLSLGSEQPFALASGDWRPAVERLIELRRNVLGFYTQPEESVEVFRRHRVALMLANYGRQQLRLLRAAGADVGYVIPREGALAWLDCWVVASGVRDRRLVEAWLDYMLEPAVSDLLVSRQGLGSTIAEAAENRPQDQLRWLVAVEDYARRERLWARVISGDRLHRVLAP